MFNLFGFFLNIALGSIGYSLCMSYQCFAFKQILTNIFIYIVFCKRDVEYVSFSFGFFK